MIEKKSLILSNILILNLAILDFGNLFLIIPIKYEISTAIPRNKIVIIQTPLGELQTIYPIMTIMTIIADKTTKKYSNFDDLTL